jgi:hypothetical protein
MPEKDQKICHIELRTPDFSGHCRTSTANSRSQCAPVEISSSSRFHQSCPFPFILARKKCQKNVPERRSEYMSEPWQTGMTVFL